MTVNRVFRSVLIPKSVRLSVCFRLDLNWHKKVSCVWHSHFAPLETSPESLLSLWNERLWRQGRQTIPAEVAEAEVAYACLSEQGSHNRIPSGRKMIITAEKREGYASVINPFHLFNCLENAGFLRFLSPNPQCSLS